ncbi:MULTISPECIES: hypothetical protein [unclassified Streptomyces]|uniref:hypothetical protein n=1 Tax=unclassified Streptomyces TaxID=2593676 RepID=UPI002E382174|nr:hypothetical protein [Streptomyces sp. NBC_01431]
MATRTAVFLTAFATTLWPGPGGRTGPQPSAESGYVARVAADAQIISSTGTTLRVNRPVQSGDAVVMALMLTSTTAGTVAVTDSQANHYAMVADVTDSYHHRTLVFASFGSKAVRPGDSFHLTWPHSSKYHVAVEEFHGVAAARGQAAGFGPYDHSSRPIAVGMSNGCAPGDLVFAAVGSNSGPAPHLASGWQRLPGLQLSSYRLTVAFRRATHYADCSLTGTSNAQWETALVSLR